MRSSQKYLYFTIFLLITNSLSLFSKDFRYDKNKIYLLPKETISREEINVIQNIEDTSEKINSIKNLLNKYYSQFVEDSRLEDEKRFGKIISENSSINEIRLYAKKLFSSYTNNHLVRDSPLLYNLHQLLGDAYFKESQINKAVEAYSMSFRYKSFDFTETRYMNPEFRTEWDENLSSQALVHQTNWSDLTTKQNEVLTEKNQLIFLKSELSRNKINEQTFQNQFKNLENSYNTNLKKLEELQTKYNNSYKDNYLNYHDSQKSILSNDLLKFGQTIKIIENNNKERLKVKDKNSISGEGLFILFDYKRNTNFFAYQLILELAYRVFPKNEEVVLEIAKEQKAAGNKRKAIDFYKLYLTLSESSNNTNSTEFKNSLLSLAKLYSEENEYVLAVKYYEGYFQSISNTEEVQNDVYALGRIYHDELGNLERASYYFRNWIENSKNKPSEVLEEKIVILEKNIFTNYGIANYYKFSINPDEEYKHLVESYTSFQKLLTIQKNEEEEFSKLKSEILKLKEGLLKEDQALNNENYINYRIKESQQEMILDKISIVTSKIKSIPKVEILNRLANFSETYKNWNDAKTYHLEILKYGTDQICHESLKKIESINDIIQKN